MSYKLRYIGFGFLLAMIAVTAYSFFIFAKANPSFFLRKQSATATTTVAYMTTGNATTTLALDLGAGGAQAADSAELLQQFTGSTTAATLFTVIEGSQGINGNDCVTTPTSCDWYTLLSTTTNALGTRAGGAIGVSSTTATALPLATPTRYIRAVFSIPANGVPGAVWAELVAKRQASN